MYSGPIIDAHTHLWDLSMHKHAWLSADSPVQALGGLEKLRRDFVVADYLRDVAHQPVAASVHIEALWDPSDPLGETEWLDRLDKSQGVAVRYTASAPFGTKQAAAILERQAAHDRVVAIRDILSFHPTVPAKSFASRPDKALDPAWRQDIARLPGLGLMLELMMYPYQLDAVLEVARRFADLQVIVNHCASPVDRDEEGMQRWRDAVRALAREPNIVLKVSNPTGYDPLPTYESVRAVMLHCIGCFGPARSILATDWPVAQLATTYDAIWDTARRVTADMTPAEQRAMFHDNAKRLYRIE